MPRGRAPHDGRPVGSTTLDREGYTIIKVSARPHVWMRAHRWAMEKKLGRKLRPDEPVHHVCRDKSCYNPDHLELVDWSDHSRVHNVGRKQPEEQVKKRKAAQRRWWRKPGIREYRGALMQSIWQRPEYRAHQAVAMREVWRKRKSDPEFVPSGVGRKDRPGVRKQRAESLSRYWTEHRDRASEIAKKRWADPAYREAQRLARVARYAK